MCKNCNSNSDYQHVGKQILPKNYRYIGTYWTLYDEHGDAIYQEFEFHADNDEMMERITPMCDMLENGGAKCNVCNHSINHGVFFQHLESGDIIVVGNDCSANILRFKVGKDFQQATLVAKLANERREFKETMNSWYPDLEDCFETLSTNKIATEIRSKAIQYRKLPTLKQVEMLRKMASEVKERKIKGVKGATGKNLTLELTLASVKTVKVQINKYKNLWEDQFQFLFQHADGWKLWVKKPMEAGYFTGIELTKGKKCTVSFPIVKQTEDDMFVVATSISKILFS